jgi:hypothetical protein
VLWHEINAAFPEKSEYGYGISKGNPGGDQSALRSGMDSARSQATAAAEREVAAADRSPQDPHPEDLSEEALVKYSTSTPKT